MLIRTLRPAVSLIVVLTLALGVLYPLVITGLSLALFPAQAHGSLLKRGNTVIGSSLIGQKFSDAKYFWGRPSATLPQPYNGLASGGSNLGPSNPELVDRAAGTAKRLRDADATARRAIPVELLTTSASGLDPDISPAAASYQVARVAVARHWSAQRVKDLVAAHTRSPWAGVLGEARINVLDLNLALDRAE